MFHTSPANNVFGFCFGFSVNENCPYGGQNKKAKMKANYKALLPKTNTTITELAQLVGTFVSCLPGVQFGKLHYRNLEIEKNKALRKHKGNYEAQLTLSSSAKDELTWWIENVDKAFNPISHGNHIRPLNLELMPQKMG